MRFGKKNVHLCLVSSKNLSIRDIKVKRFYMEMFVLQREIFI